MVQQGCDVGGRISHSLVRNDKAHQGYLDHCRILRRDAEMNSGELQQGKRITQQRRS